MSEALTRAEARKIWKANGGTDAPALGPEVMTIPADQFHDFVAAILARVPSGAGEEPQPVAWMWSWPEQYGAPLLFRNRGGAEDEATFRKGGSVEPLYARPVGPWQPDREAVKAAIHHAYETEGHIDVIVEVAADSILALQPKEGA